MEKIKPAIVAAVIAITVPLMVLAFNWFDSKPDAAVKIAINAPLTGPIAAWSGQFPNGFKMGVEDATRAQGIDPALFSVDIQDNGGKPSNAVSIFSKQEMAGFDAYISVATGPANANAPALDAMEKPHFIASFDPLITKAAPNRLRVMANSKIEAPLFMDYARRRQAKSVFVMQINMAYAEEQWSTIVIPALEKDGIQVTRERFELPQRDFKNLAQKAKVANADLIYIVGYSFHVQPALQALRSAGLVKDRRVISVMDFVDLVYTGTPTEELRGVVFVAPIFDVPGKISKAEGWRKRYEEKFNMTPTYVPAYAYDNATMIVNAYAKSGKVNTETLIGATPFDGINGNIEIDQDRDIVATVTLAEIDEKGQIRELTPADFSPLR
uniref:ABC-type branched-chain amino acid transport system, substrate-binding protein n=1 Tax=Candidatus Kentrum sp. FM TaxID=2126340 RepID=A0A450S6Y3_9GAMM|nr:MAG: ABC-type branched-chain amino acid transport system, substrate-binding protein [Candidatus Kentron sp. FM]VFJ47652.1 MAG: ABC-type branched-chain amino acid transport system, substrate-binding protein [Candidatus Kentron sp. FM]VFK07663.1 MAG: ABC-type branched-chain amino acid transport system, substrate-binding protein [Candidatus Kentron sp. FM]